MVLVREGGELIIKRPPAARIARGSEFASGNGGAPYAY